MALREEGDSQGPDQGALWGPSRHAVWWFALAFSLYHVATAGLGDLPNLVHRSIHVSGAMVLAMLIYAPIRKDLRRPGIIEFAGILVALVTPVWIWFSYDRFMMGIAGPTMADEILTVLFILFLLEATRRVIGLPFVIIVGAFILYAFKGNWLPGPLRSAGLDPTTVAEFLFMTTDGLWGVTTAVTASVVGVYIVMGEILLVTGGGQIFVDLASRVAGRSMGGPGKVAVISSSLFGMLSGAPAANAVVTGNFTINLMKRRGYKPPTAAAIEAVASSGSQIMPPVMGAAAFIMAEFLGMQYIEIIIAAILPAILFYATVFFAVHLHGKKFGIGGSMDAPKADLRWWIQVLTTFVIPVGILIGVLLQGYTTSKAAFWAIVAALIIFFLGDLRPSTMGPRFRRIVEGLVNGGRSLVLIALLAGAAQIVVGLIGLTGFGVKLSSAIIAISAGNMFVTLVVAAAVALVLGMGMPTTAVYILSASVVAPALVDLGILPIAAHMFLFYYGLLAAITPPVCVAVFVCAGIAQADWLETAWDAMKIGIAKFIIPFVFVYNYQLLMRGSEGEIVFAVATALFGAYALSVSTTLWMIGRLPLWQAPVMLVAGVLMLIPDLLLTAVGFALFAAVWFPQWRRYGRSRAPAPAG